MTSISHFLNVNELGQGTAPMLLVHGFGCDQTVWRRLIPFLEKDFRLILVDLAGFGYSAPEAYDVNRHDKPSGHAEDIVALCDELDLEGAVMLGHSIGGTIGMLASIQRPNAFKRLAMICSSARYLDDPPDYYGGYTREQLDGLMQLMEHNYHDWAGTVSRVALGDAGTEARQLNLQQRFLEISPDVLGPLAKSIFLGDTRHHLPDVSVPSLIIQTARDAMVPVEAAQYLQQHLVDSELVALDAAGHYPQLTAPDILANELQPRLEIKEG
ncbi:alpha/beta fold hydrolase [Vreelandella arcis]|uniref:Pimeloyl-ACP methyl ester carboxylesterase n=1 Tax=Vreelandella arcis TaxID=416873 RepID=A0A1G9XNK4_9GAMM|nr:alpha/beta hydrolase [Halomonas arcis]SDM98367.1 Pimeloyl-ACP methyl ester carboxylesterase [Halomonas arcis]